MKKTILLRSAIGFPVGVCVCNLILLIIAFFLGTYAPCSPACTALFGSERTGVAVQFLLSGLVGACFCRQFRHLGSGNCGACSVPLPPTSALQPRCSGELLCCWAGAV